MINYAPLKLKNYDLSFGNMDTLPKVDSLIIHHTGNPTNDDLNAQQIHTSHLGQSWSGIGYHYVIRKNGQLEIGRPEKFAGSHCYDQHKNYESLGIHVSGNFELGRPDEIQIEMLAMLLAHLCMKYKLAPYTAIKGHKDFGATACPGFHLYNILPEVRGKAQFYIDNGWK